MLRRLLALALLALASPAHADYVFDPADLPKDFACRAASGEQECARERRHEAWWTRHGEHFDRWFHELLFNTDTYFADFIPGEIPAGTDQDTWEPRSALNNETPNLVDAVYMAALERFGGWAFAVDLVCPKGAWEAREQCAPKLRMVSPRRTDEIAPEAAKALKTHLPTTRAEVAANLRQSAKWEEADLRTCPGALHQLLALPAQVRESLWHPRYVEWLRGKPPRPPEEIVVATDGAGVFVRARGTGDPSAGYPNGSGLSVQYSQWNGGAGMAWAVAMAKVARPCLKPAVSPAPWDKIMAGLDKAAP